VQTARPEQTAGLSGLTPYEITLQGFLKRARLAIPIAGFSGVVMAMIGPPLLAVGWTAVSILADWLLGRRYDQLAERAPQTPSDRGLLQLSAYACLRACLWVAPGLYLCLRWPTLSHMTYLALTALVLAALAAALGWASRLVWFSIAMPAAAAVFAAGAAQLPWGFELAGVTLALGGFLMAANTMARTTFATIQSWSEAEKKSLEALDRSEAAERRLAIAVRNTALYVYEVDFKSKTVTSQGAEEDFYPNGLTYQSFIANPYAFVGPQDLERTRAKWAAYEAGEGLFHMEYLVPREDGREVWAAMSAELERDEAGRPSTLVTAIQNITERKRSERELLEARDRAEAANRAKSEFLANMSHEIRTPLNGMVGMADVLGRSKLKARDREMVEVIRGSAEALNLLLSDILDLARIEAGGIRLETRPFHLGDLVRGVAALSRLRAEEKGVGLEVEVSPRADRAFAGDPLRVRQVVTNLVSNAVKFTERGSVRLAAEATPTGRIRIEVRDTGVGFAPEVKDQVFGRFQQADGSISRRFGGTGLGLSISHQLAGLMGGVLDCESRPGEGSRFWFEVQLAPADATEVAPAEAAELSAAELTVLVADDHPTNRKVVQMILEDAGARLAMAEDGAEALELFRAGAFDLVLMDMQMPEMDGLSATRAIRALEAAEGRARTPILMLTANAMVEHVAAGAEAGADGHIPKPITAAALLGGIAAALSSGAPDSKRRSA
jgi:signal transduction histidine kinase/AmiR/NasT family two-component response regulator